MANHSNYLLAYQPVIDRRQQIAGLRLSIEAGASNPPRTGVKWSTLGADLNHLWPIHDLPILLGLESELELDGQHFELPRNAILEIGEEGLGVDALARMNGHRPQLCAVINEGDRLPPAFATGLPFECLKLAVSHVDPPSRLLAQYKNRSVIVSGAATKADFGRAMSVKTALIEGRRYFQPSMVADTLQSGAAANVIGLLELVNSDADIVQIEAYLKRDPVLAFKLVALVNSAANGLRTEVRSFQHALTMLGMRRLKRWLSLLLLGCKGGEAPQFLMHTALVRALFIEQIGTTLGWESGDDLFLCGAFSLLDEMLGTSFDAILEQVPLAPAVADALTHRGDPFGPLLALAEATEGMSTHELATRAQALALAPHQINCALLVALRVAPTFQL